MINYDHFAAKLGLSPHEFEQASLRTFIQHRLHLLESRLMDLSRKFGVKTIEDLDQLIQDGKVHEQEGFEEYFEFDNLEAERDLLLESLKELD
jgi:hypothetical protein